jgi:hypothetical protein
MAKIKVIMVRVGQDPVVENMDNSLEAMQKAVGGYIEGMPLFADIMLICNEQGKLERLPLNRCVAGEHIVGDFFITRNKNGHNVSLTHADIKQLIPFLAAARANTLWGA